MKLVTKELLRKTPRLGATSEVSDPACQFKLFTPTAGWSWFLIEIDEEARRAFGFAYRVETPECAELGYIDIDELRKLRGPFGLGVERDLYWSARPLSAVRRELGLELGPWCGHSACRQHWIESGSRGCVCCRFCGEPEDACYGGGFENDIPAHDFKANDGGAM